MVVRDATCNYQQMIALHTESNCYILVYMGWGSLYICNYQIIAIGITNVALCAVCMEQ